MGLGTRIFIVKEDDSLQRLSLKRYNRLIKGHPDEGLMEFTGKVIDVKHRFAKKRFDDRYLWKPAPEIETAIQRAIFG